MITISRYHDFSYGHRVMGHENKCAHIHGHNARVTFVVSSEDKLDKIGRVLDFSLVNTYLCQWIEDCWDHKFIVYREDPLFQTLLQVDPKGVWLSPFNPTAENFAEYLVKVVGPQQLPHGIKLISVTFEETRKCSATYTAEEKK